MLKTVFFTICLFCLPSVFAKQSVIFINPGHADTNVTGPFWFEVSQMMRDAAKDFDLDLTIHYANRNHIEMKSLVAKAIKAKPDMLILVDEKSVLTQHLLSIEHTSTPIYFLLNRPSEKELKRLIDHGINITGSVVPDNTQAGQLLANKLIENSQQAANVFAINGDYTTHAALDREQGLKQSILTHDNTHITAKTVANWSATQAYRHSLGFFSHQPTINIVWAANDAMALGAIAALDELNKRKEVLVGAINWPLRAVAEKIDVTIGGHVTLGALAVVNIHDLLNKHSSGPIHQKVAIFSQHNEQTLKLVEQIHSDNLAINFRVFSKAHKNALPFSVESLLLEATKSAL
ncbi:MULTISPECIES: ABC transporter substrate-binding protein [unclassified Pseudoalteromonas]|uniref:ABC transporter substrate-binding protein n=1 Tax=unclassified Pseudoalteromonas TaxID=194690 RepID=UPI0010205DA6|nr:MULTISPECIES: ABC transporter substrate-binding protein [unclassified Pseudoalteromonas]MCG9708319.1 ABC transporter substrate-binding protein [Pseudoalteromonas sp. Isolate3]RZD20196.1 sugar ABC transporter substrate-binding protein [Pseudoalteromonas sp. MEBiC 03485]